MGGREEGGSGKGTAAHASGLLLGLAEGSHRQLHARGYGEIERERKREWKMRAR